MSNKATLKAFFETGDIPTEVQFADLIDSNINTDDAAAQEVTSDVEFLGNVLADGQITVKGKVVPFTTTPTFDLNKMVQKMVITSDITSLSISNELPSGIYTIFLTQDSTGGHSIPLPDSSFGTISRVSQSEYSLNADAINSINIQVDPDGNKIWWINSTGITWYVRPSGGSFGAEDGTSYDNAWNGFDEIVWSNMRVGDTLVVAGTHTETLTVGSAGITIRGDHAGDAGIVDSQDIRNIGIDIVSKNNVTLTSISSINAVNDCINIAGTSKGIITNDITASGSGNQGLQHLDFCSAVHNNPTCSDNNDDGISGHDSSVIVVNNGLMDGNNEGINYIESVNITINGTVFSNSGIRDVRGVNGTCVINNVDFDGLLVFLDGSLTLNNCTNIDLGPVIDGDFLANNSVFSALIPNHADATSTITLDACTINGMDFTQGFGTYNITNSNFISIVDAFIGGMDVTINRCFVNLQTSHSFEIDDVGGITSITNCIFKGASAKFGVVVRQGNDSTVTVDNNTFDGNGVGNGIFTDTVTLTVNNNILNNCTTGIFMLTGSLTVKNSCFFGNTADINGAVTLIDEVTGDPNFVDSANDNYTLDTGSSCIGTGLDITTNDEGIDTADWGDANTAPVITTKIQGVNWDIGAYIS